MVAGHMETEPEGGIRHSNVPLDLSYHPPGESGVGVVGKVGATMLVVSLGVEQSQDLVDAGLAADHWRLLELQNAALTLLREFSSGDPHSSLLLEELALQLFTSSNPMAEKAARQPGWWRTLVEVLEEADQEKWSLKDIAGQLGLHPSHLCSTHKALTGATMGETLRRRRLKRAYEAIVHSSGRLGTVALDYGFADQSHFIRCFRRTFGVLPSELRPLLRACHEMPGASEPG
jgi:AraC-like DNA-binding protein